MIIYGFLLFDQCFNNNYVILFAFVSTVHARNPPSIQLNSLELQQAFETVMKVLFFVALCHSFTLFFTIFHEIIINNNQKNFYIYGVKIIVKFAVTL